MDEVFRSKPSPRPPPKTCRLPNIMGSRSPSRGVRAVHSARMSDLNESVAALAKLKAAISGVFLGNPQAVDQVLICLLARGHCLIEDVPGVGKTVLATALARGISASFSRIQLTPDLLPSDLIGVSVYRKETDKFEFKRGPIFANIVLADEINRATPRAQSALLEAMSDAAVTVDGVTHKLEAPFMLVATQNPTDFEGTFTLPENQLDRFLLRVTLGYPSADVEASVLMNRPSQNALLAMHGVLSGSQIVELQSRVDTVKMDRSLVDYIVSIAKATRNHDALALGLSPRGSLALSQAARATAVLQGREYVTPDDIAENVVPVAAHRLLTRSGPDPKRAAAILRELLQLVPTPQ